MKIKTGKNIECAICGKLKYFPAWYIKQKELKGSKKYHCSKECDNESKKLRHSRGVPSVKIKCIVCKKEFKAWQSNINVGKSKTCSWKCAKISISNTLTGRKNPKHSEFMKGKQYSKKNTNDLKISRSQAYDTRYKEWMNSVKKRDNWKCRIRNKDCCGKLESHHILPWRDFPELRYDIKNGITLCIKHHPRKRSEEFNLINVFKNLIK